MTRAQLVGLVAACASLAGAWIDPRVFAAAWLAAWWWAIGLVLGACVNAWISVLSGGWWGVPVRAAALVLMPRMRWLLGGLALLALGAHALYPWAADPGGEWSREFARPAFVRAWLAQPFFALRLAVYGIAWWWLARPASMASKGRAAASLAVYALTTTLAAVDLLMSLVPGWYSTAFGLVAMSAQALGGAAAAALLAARGDPRRWRSAKDAPVLRDLGNLLLMWVMTWAYLAFMEFLVIWSENLPREIAWYLPRLHTGWVWGALALCAAQLAVPVLALLFRATKDRPTRLAAMSAWLLGATALNAAWLVIPSVAPHSLHAWWMVPLAVASTALLLLGGLGPANAVDGPLKGAMRHA